MIQLRHAQPTLWHGGLTRDIEDLWEPWMREADRLLDDASAFDLNELYDLKRGKYTVQVYQNDSIAQFMIKSNTITVTVTP